MPRNRLLTLGALLALALVVPGLTHGQPAPGKDQDGDPLPEGALARAGSLRWRHGGPASFVSFLPDGKHVLTVVDQTVRIWEYPSGKLARSFGPGGGAADMVALERQVALLRAGGSLQGAALSKDGKIVGVNFDGTAVKFFEVDSGKELTAMKMGATSTPRGLGVPSFAFDPEGKHLATLEPSGKIHVMDRETGKEVRSFGGGNQIRVAGIGSFLLYSPDGKQLVTMAADVEDGALKLSLKFYDAAGKALHTVPMQQQFFGGATAVFSPDSKSLAYWAGNAIKVIDAATGKEQQTLQEMNGPRRATGALLFGKDSKTLYSVNQTGQLKEWDVATGKEVRVLAEAPKGAVPRPTLSRPGLAGSGIQLALSPEGDVVALGGQDNVVHFFEVKTGKELPLPGSAAPLLAVCFTADGKLVTESSDLSLRQYDAANGKALAAPKLPQGAVAVALSPDATLAVVQAPQGLLILIETATGREIAKAAKLQREQLTAVTFAADGKTLAVRWLITASVEVYDVPSLKLRTTVSMPGAEPQPNQRQPASTPPLLALSADGKLVAAYSDATTLSIYHTSSGQKVADLAGLGQQIVRTAAFSPDGRCFAADLGGNSVIVFELATGTVRQTLTVQGPAAPALPVQPTFVAGGFGGPVAVNAPRPKVAFAPDGRRLAFAAPDRAVHVWDLATGKEAAVFKGHSGALTSVAFAPGGKQLASASTDTTALVWDLSTVAVTAPAPRELPPYQMAASWEQLKDGDGAKAFAAINDMAAAPKDSVTALIPHLKPAAPVDPKLIEQLVADLDHDTYKVRQKASSDLLKVGERAVPYIDKALAAKPGLETKTRLEKVRSQLTTVVLVGDRLREYRAIEVLERIGTPEAQKVLQTLADGAPGALSTEASRAALERLKK
jgi:WD40 repeat protein